MNRPCRRNLAAFFAAIAPAALISAGCAMCCGPSDYDYPAFGGKIQRADPVYGRVGSVFSDPNMAGMGPLADSNIVEPPKEKIPGRGNASPDLLPGELPVPKQPLIPSENVDRATMNQWRQSPQRGPIGYR